MENTQENTQQPEELSRTVVLNRQNHYLSIVISYLSQQIDFAREEMDKITQELEDLNTPEDAK